MKLKKIKDFFSNIITSDTYPTLRLNKVFSIRVEYAYPSFYGTLKENTIIKFFDNIRIIFWSKIAKLHPGFECCYYKNYKISNNKYIKQIQRNGFVEIENFISKKEDFEIISKECLEIKKTNKEYNQKSRTDKLVNAGYFPLTKKSYEILNKYLNKYTKEFFGQKTFPKIFANLQFSFSGKGEKNRNDGTVFWHADRFIPTINAQFYPFGSDGWMPTQRIVKSPYIANHEEAKKLQYHYENLDDYSKESFEIFSPVCKPNTAIIAFHHILHRKYPISSKGERFMIFVTYYRAFTKKKLIKSALMNLFKLQKSN